MDADNDKIMSITRSMSVGLMNFAADLLTIAYTLIGVSRLSFLALRFPAGDAIVRRIQHFSE